MESEELMNQVDLNQTLVNRFIQKWVLDVVRQRVAGKIVQTFTIWCATCDAHISPNSDTKSWAAAQARKEGWKEKRYKGWLCPSCLKPAPPTTPRPEFGKPLPMPQDMIDQIAELDAEEQQKNRLVEALTLAGNYLYGKIPDDPQWYDVIDATTKALQEAGAPIPWIAWSGELEEVEEGCTCSKGDNYCPVHNADYARYIRS
jgi:hypothetical protein